MTSKKRVRPGPSWGSGTARPVDETAPPLPAEGAPVAAIPAAVAVETTDPAERLEKLVRAVARDNLEMARGQREIAVAVAGLPAVLDAMDLSLKGVQQQTWRFSQEVQTGIGNAEEHFAGAIRELEARLLAEMKSQIFRNACLALLPAIDDMDLVIAHQQSLESAGQDPVLDALVGVRQKLAEGLRGLGLEEVAVEAGKTVFDPNLHRAVPWDLPGSMPLQGDVPKGTVLIVRRSGYRLSGALLRNPQVIIAS
jgi:molecular chaperone GrpE (heat shock protein)